MSNPRAALTDTHCHLTVGELAAQSDELLSRARGAGVGRILVPGIDLATSRAAVELSRRQPDVAAAVGLHPHNAESWSAVTRSELRELAQDPAVVAIGEIGLDFYRDLAPRAAQRAALAGQLELAAELGKPVILHNRQATGELIETLIEWAAGLSTDRKSRAGVLHAFSGSPQDAEAAIQAGFYLGVAGPVTYPNAEPLRQTLQQLTIERLLLETDTPYLAPQAHRGERNEPAFLPLIAERLADLLDLDAAATARLTSRNATDLFGLPNGNQNP